MKKVISVTLCLMIILAFFAACGEETVPETTGAPTEPPTEPPVQEVVFATEPDARKYLGIRLQYVSMLAENDPEARALAQAAEVFNRQTGAEVAFSWLGGDEAALMQNLEQGSADIFETSSEALRSMDIAYALDLTAFAQAADYESHSYAALRQQVVGRCGYLAGIPSVPYLTGVYYNAEVFEACGITGAPGSWEEFMTVCRMLTQYGYGPLALDAEKAATALELHLERSLGAERLAALLSGGGWNEDPTAMFAIQQITEFVDAGFLAAGSLESYPAGQNRIGLSNAVMAVGTNVLCTEVAQAAAADIRWGVFAWPGGSTGTGTAVDADVLAVHKDSANAQAAFDFIMLLTTGEFDQLRADLRGGIPADPANPSVIAGASEAMAAAGAGSPGLFSQQDNQKILKLWQGKYKIQPSVG